MQVFSVEFETDKCIFFSGVVCSFRAHEVKFSLGVDGRTLAASKRLGFACQRSFAFGGRVEAYDWSSAALKVDSPVLIQAHRKYKLSVTANLAVGTETRRVAQIAGREAKQPSGTAELLQNEEKGTQHEREPVHFTLTYGEARCTFAEILYRNVDDTIYCV
ncbi:hypothetical protein AAVH_40815 [Aphelenchoides avenae]|nr:hypothetical protein AAVH_40815 [Aphelenchus avenae]